MKRGFVRRFLARCLVLLLGVFTAVCGFVTPLAPRAVAAPVVPNGSEEVGVLSAARSSGRPVELASATTETTRVMAQPQGFFRAEVSAVPVRKKTPQGWRDLDARLVRGSGGRLVPVVGLSDVSVSGGGSGPLVSIVRDGLRMDLIWPGNLPSPRVDGDVAIFGEVMAGVDLVVRTATEGFSHFLVVKDSAAAAQLAEVPIMMQWRGSGLQV